MDFGLILTLFFNDFSCVFIAFSRLCDRPMRPRRLSSDDSARSYASAGSSTRSYLNAPRRLSRQITQSSFSLGARCEWGLARRGSRLDGGSIPGKEPVVYAKLSNSNGKPTSRTSVLFQCEVQPRYSSSRNAKGKPKAHRAREHATI